MPKPAVIPSTPATLAAAAAVIGAFRAGLERAGYPFREPPDTRAVLADIDALLHPDELTSRRKCDSVPESPASANHAPKYGRTPAL